MTSELNRRQMMACLTAFLAGCGGTGAVVEPQSGGVTPDPGSTFHRIYDDPALRERFALFLKNVFRLVPDDPFHQLIWDATKQRASDEQIYLAIAEQLPKITPVGSMVRFALPALKKQKQAMAGQMAALLPPTIEGYLEIGTPGRYVNALKKQLTLNGPVFVVDNDAPSKDPADIVERGQLAPVGTYLAMGNYDPIDAAVPDGSLDVVSNLIGFHHSPDDRLEGFVQGIRRVLKPGGRLVVREHDVVDAGDDPIVTLAHDVFNVGTGLTWSENQSELRHFRSVAEWESIMKRAGLARRPGGLLQAGDPTDNTLLCFEKV